MSTPHGSVIHRNATVEILGTLLVRAAALGRVILIGRLFSPEAYGAFSTGMAILLLPQAMAQAGIKPLLVRASTPEYQRLFGTAVVWSAAGALVLYGVAVALGPPLASLFGEPGLAALIMVLGLGIFEAIWVPYRAHLERELRFGRARALEATGLAVGIGVLLILASTGVDPVWCMAYSFAASVACKGLLFLLASGVTPPLKFEKDQIRSISTFALPLVAAAVPAYVAGRGDDLAVRWFNGPSAMGLYLMAFYLPTVMQDVVDSVNRVSLPIFARIKERSELAAAFETGVRFSAVLSAPIGFGGALFSEHLVVAMFGEEWVEGAPLLSIFFVAFALRASTGLNWSSLALLTGRTTYIALVSLASAAFLVVVGLPLVWWLGPLGGAVYSLVQLIVMGPAVRFPVIRGALGGLGSLGASITPLLLSATVFGGLYLLGARSLSPWAGVATLCGSVVSCQAALFANDRYFSRRFRPGR